LSEAYKSETEATSKREEGVLREIESTRNGKKEIERERE
jgi:hypothetical protein